MRLAFRELLRRPSRFLLAGGVLTLLTSLLLVLGGLLDGLFLGATGAIRTQDAQVFVYSKESRDQFLRSRITPELRATVDGVDGVERTGGLGIAQLTAEVPGESEPADVVVVGYELATNDVPVPPPPGQGYADRTLESAGVKVGTTLLVGPAQVPVEVAGFVDDTDFLLQGTVWVEPGTWREVLRRSRPDIQVADGVFQVLVVQTGRDPAALADAVDAATAGATSSLTKQEATFSLPGTREQNATFNQIIGTTGLVALVVVALFFSLLTLERTGLYGVLKAVGASSATLFGGVVLQALLVTLGAFVLGSVLMTVLASFVPPGTIPLTLVPSRYVVTLVILVVAAVLGATVSLRRVLRIDPASAIGAGI